MSWCCLDALLSRINHVVPCYEGEDGFSSAKNIKLFAYKELTSATNNFHPSNRIGRGGFGTVYKGTLSNGVRVAAKVLSAEASQGVKEFLTEIDTISNVKHPNLVELMGCCIQGDTRILVYEYLENSSLDRALHGSKDSVKLSWSKRSAICIGTARSLAFLHDELEPHIVHRDIKASNILLDRNFMPKIGDFGLAKLFPDSVTHISTRIAGTMGYLAPEYAMHGQLTKKADVYSFGVLILVIVSGRRTSAALESDTEQLLLEWTWRLYEEGKLLDLVDPELGEYPEDEVKRYIKVALFCTQEATSRRPSMPQVFRMLSKPVRLKEIELTPPGLLPKSVGNSGRSRTTNSSDSSRKDSLSAVPGTAFTTPPVTFTQMVAR